MSKTILHMHPTSWYVSLPSLHDNEVNLRNDTFYDGQTQGDDFCSSFPNLDTILLELESRKVRVEKNSGGELE